MIGGTGIGHAPYIYVGGASSNTWLPVVAANDGNGANPLCFSGATGGEKCGLDLIDDDYDTQYVFFGHSYTITHLQFWQGDADHGSCPGDSGAPVYRKASGEIKIRGLVSGGHATFQSPPEFASPIRWSWPGTAAGLVP